MTLAEYIKQHGHNTTAKKYGIPSTNLWRMKNDGCLVELKDGELIKIIAPRKAVWEIKVDT